ncbi:Transmembrane protein 41B, partial [Perkinsus olseni]
RYMLFLRITPIVPNWFINISTGNLGLSSRTFFFGTLLGLIPNNVILVNMGSELAEIQHVGGFNAKNFLVLLGLGCLALIPTLLKRQLSTDENDEHLLVGVAANGKAPTEDTKSE